MNRRTVVATAGLTVAVALGLWLSVDNASGDPPPRGDAVIFVTSQGLYYDSIVNGPLPQHGPFQLLEETESGLQTQYGPGDPGYRGGRWMIDGDGDGEIDTYFECPLLPPGREMP